MASSSSSSVPFFPPLVPPSPGADDSAHASLGATDLAAGNQFARMTLAFLDGLIVGQGVEGGGDNVDAVSMVPLLEERMSAVATAILREQYTVRLRCNDTHSSASSSVWSGSESGSEIGSEIGSETGSGTESETGSLCSLPPLLLTPTPHNTFDPPRLLAVHLNRNQLDRRVSSIAGLAASTKLDAQKVVLYVAELPGVVPLPKHDDRPEAIMLTLSDGVVQVVSRWAVPKPYHKDNLPAFSKAPALLELQVLVLRRYGDHGETEEMRLVIVHYKEVNEEAGVQRPCCWQLRGLPIFQPAPQVPERCTLEFDAHRLGYTCCDGTQCSHTFQVAEGHTSGSDYGTTYDNGGDGEPGLLHVSCCVLRNFEFPPLETMKEMNKYADKEIVDMDNSEKRHLCYYYIARTMFRATQRLPLGECIKTTVRTLYPPAAQEGGPD